MVRKNLKELEAERMAAVVRLRKTISTKPLKKQLPTKVISMGNGGNRLLQSVKNLMEHKEIQIATE